MKYNNLELVENNNQNKVIINEFDRYIKMFTYNSQPKEKDLDIKYKYIILPYINEINEITAKNMKKIRKDEKIKLTVAFISTNE